VQPSTPIAKREFTFVSEEAFYYSYYDDLVEGQSFREALLEDTRTVRATHLQALRACSLAPPQ